MPIQLKTFGESEESGHHASRGTAVEDIKRRIEDPENTYQSGARAGMHKPGDYIVRELDEAGREVGASGPDPGAEKGSIWYKQTIEHAMGNASTEPPNPDRVMDRRSPGGPTADDLDELRPKVAGDRDPMRMDPGTRAAQRVRAAVGGAWETLKHGVNNPGQPQVEEELKKVAQETGQDTK